MNAGLAELNSVTTICTGKAGQVTAVGIHDVYGTEYGDRISMETGVMLKE